MTFCDLLLCTNVSCSSVNVAAFDAQRYMYRQRNVAKECNGLKPPLRRWMRRTTDRYVRTSRRFTRLTCEGQTARRCDQSNESSVIVSPSLPASVKFELAAYHFHRELKVAHNEKHVSDLASYCTASYEGLGGISGGARRRSEHCWCILAHQHSSSSSTANSADSGAKNR